MLTGMIVVRHGRPAVVAGIQAPPIGIHNIPNDTVYTLVDGDANVERLTSPKAEEMPLLPACPSCGANAEPGQYGSPGWICAEGCAYGVHERVALL